MHIWRFMFHDFFFIWNYYAGGYFVVTFLESQYLFTYYMNLYIVLLVVVASTTFIWLI